MINGGGFGQRFVDLPPLQGLSILEAKIARAGWVAAYFRGAVEGGLVTCASRLMPNAMRVCGLFHSNPLMEGGSLLPLSSSEVLLVLGYES